MPPVLQTADGSHTLVSEIFGQTYHSAAGAVAESQRIFIELGLHEMARRQAAFSILEMGFGTGLNALMSHREASRLGLQVHYTAIEAYPVPPEGFQGLNYDYFLKTSILQQLHTCPWETSVPFGPAFTLHKHAGTFQDFLQKTSRCFDLVYFDAFAPDVQPELWSEALFTLLAAHVRPGGLLTTYSSKGSVRRALAAAGFRVEKHPGPGSKREVVRAERI